MRYVMVRLKEYSRDLSYRIYVSDSLQAIAKNTKTNITSNGIVEHGLEMRKRWIEAIMPKTEEKSEVNPKKDEEQDCQQAVSGIWKRAKLKKKA